MYQKTHRQNLSAKCKTLETQINNLFYSGGTTSATGNDISHDKFEQVLNRAIEEKAPGVVIDYATMSVSTENNNKLTSELIRLKR